jgi:hypothetical protein
MQRNKAPQVVLCYWHRQIARFQICGATAAPAPADAAQDEGSQSSHAGSMEPDLSILGIVLAARGGGKQDAAAHSDTAQSPVKGDPNSPGAASSRDLGDDPVRARDQREDGVCPVRQHAKMKKKPWILEARGSRYRSMMSTRNACMGCRPIKFTAPIHRTVPKYMYDQNTCNYTALFNRRVGLGMVQLAGSSGPGYQIGFPHGRGQMYQQTQYWRRQVR